MTGKIKTMIDDIIEKRSKGNPVISGTMKTKMKLKGIDVEKYTAASDDDPVIIGRLNEIYDAMTN